MASQFDKVRDKFRIICRICLKSDGPMSPIFTTSETERDNEPLLSEKITSIAQVKASVDDALPASICKTCRQQVDKFYDFRCLIEISDHTLRSYLNGLSDDRQSFVRTIDANDLDYQEYLLEDMSTVDCNDLFSINTILIPSDSGTEVWQICSMDEENIAEEEEEPEVTNTSTNVFVISDLTGKIANANVQESKKVPRHVASKLQPVELPKKTITENETFYSATKSEKLDKSTNEYKQLICHTILSEKNDIPGANKAEPEVPILPVDEYSCQLCLNTFKSLRSLKNHVRDHFNGGKSKKSVVNVNETGIKKNRINSRESVVKRIIVESEESNNDSLAKRLASCENNNEKPRGDDKSRERKNSRKHVQKVHSCDKCGRIFSKKSQLNYHKTVHTDSSLICSICGKKLSNEQSYKTHFKRHELDTRFNCHECGKRYHWKSELSRHARLHTGKREHSCEFCERAFFSRPELNRHLKYHNGNKNFECQICHKTYYESGHLKIHARTHSGERPFPCDICEKAFITKSKLMRHRQTHERYHAGDEKKTSSG